MNIDQFKGTGVALVTPFAADGSVDTAALKKLVGSVTEGGVDYLVALGTTSESPTLSKKEKSLVLETILEANEGRLPVVMGMGGNNTQELVTQLSEAIPDGVTGILSVAPYYNRPGQEGIYRHFKAVSDASPLPIILYNVPTRTSCNISAETTIRLAKECSNIVAVKEATSDMSQCMHLIQHKPDNFLVLSGDDIFTITQLALGFDGVISVAANCFAAEFSALVKAGLSGDFVKARNLHYQLLHGMELLFAEGNPAGVKAVLAAQGILRNHLRLPLIAASEALTAEIGRYLKEE